MEILVSATIQSVRVEGDQAWTEVLVEGRVQRHHTERVLMAAGRKPNTEGIGLEAVGVALERGFVRVNEMMETNVPGIYAIGDMVPGPALAHVASHEGMVAVEKIAGLHPHPV